MKKAQRVFFCVGVSGGIARVRPCLSTYAPGFPPVVSCGIKHHMPVGPLDGWTQTEGSVSTVSPIITMLSVPSCPKSATVVSTQSSTPQHAWLSRPFTPAIQANSLPTCSVCPVWHHRVSSTAPRLRAASQPACLTAHLLFPLVFCSCSPPPHVESRQFHSYNHQAGHAPQPTLQRVRWRQRFPSPEHMQRLLAADGLIAWHGRLQRHCLTAPEYRQAMAQRCQTWQEILGTATARAA
jgi:hypothetical protein